MNCEWLLFHNIADSIYIFNRVDSECTDPNLGLFECYFLYDVLEDQQTDR